MITVALCEDNDIQRDLMEEILREYSRTHTEIAVQSFSSGNVLLKQVRADHTFFDIYILDIIMPDMNGMEVASTLRLLNDTGKIIFTTASLEYAVASYDVQAFYYMVKPVDAQKLYKILDNNLKNPADDLISLPRLYTPRALQRRLQHLLRRARHFSAAKRHPPRLQSWQENLAL